MFGRYLKTVLNGERLNADEAYSTAHMLLHDAIPATQAAALLGALRTRKESFEELSGFVEALLEEAVTIDSEMELIDTCGTGGDGLGTFNISTAAALIVASCGVAVAKHGNRAMSGSVGSADVLEALGVNVQMEPDHARRMLEKVGMTFLFAPNYHPVLKQVGPLRRELGVATIFNFLGPLLNPCSLSYQILGLADGDLQEAVASTLASRGLKRAMVVHADNGMDEISPASYTRVFDVDQRGVRIYNVHPEDAGFQPVSLDAVRGGSAEANAQIMLNIAEGELSSYRDAAILNAAAALMTAGKAANLKEGAQIASESIKAGKTKALLKNMISFSRDQVLVC
ncbi:MAG TPA: anthranilate phosphoribosyltransferase [Syntrophomonadaceae bacterium]|nr:anthranilate phosphoribosyltransferase [Syntrophomonadaceae bacterium]